jgi:hypothetical protein
LIPPTIGPGHIPTLCPMLTLQDQVIPSSLFSVGKDLSHRFCIPLCRSDLRKPMGPMSYRRSIDFMEIRNQWAAMFPIMNLIWTCPRTGLGRLDSDYSTCPSPTGMCRPWSHVHQLLSRHYHWWVLSRVSDPQWWDWIIPT